MRTIPIVEIPSGLTTRRGQELAGERWRVHVPVQFRGAAEAWLRYALETGGNDLGVWAHVKSFLRWYDSAHPGTLNLVDLQPQDLTTFAEALYAIPTRTHTGHRSTKSIQMAAQGTRRFLAFLQATGSDLLDPALSLDTFKARTPLRNGRFILAEAPAPVCSVAEVEQRARAELAGDIWNLERIPGVKIKDHHTKFTLTFNRIPPAFRPLVKEYVGFNLLVAGTVPSTEAMRISSLARFFTRFAEKHSTADDLRQLTAADVADFVAYLRATPGKRGGGCRPAYLNDHLGDVEGLIRHLQRHEHALAPFKVADQIFLPEFRQREPRQGAAVTKYIPKMVLEQLDQHLLDLPPHVRPIVVVLRASGWRISDVLMLQYDRCLRREGNQWWLVGDIQKTEIFGHEIPLDAEVAAIIEAHAAGIREQFDERRNPKRYLFPSAFSIRAGKPWSSTTVSDALNKLATDHHMVGEDGHIFRFKTHAFRHTKAVELINDYRMPLEFVRDWLGHASETMTRVYAKILSETMRKVFAEAAAQGAVRIDAHGRPQRIDLDGAETFQDLGLTVLELASIRAHLDARRVEIAYCFKPAKFECKYAEIPCWTCPAALSSPSKTSGCVSQSGLPDLACTPGSTDARVKQSNIASTICRRGYTATVRPSVGVTEPIKRERIAAYGVPANQQSTVVLDHLVPLQLGGSSQDAANLWPEPTTGSATASMKDAVESYLNGEVCGGRMQLADAQRQIASDWLSVYKNRRLTPAQGPENP
jgi:integrase